MVHSDSMSPTSPEIWSKLSRRWELNTSLAKGSARHSQQTLTMRMGLPSLSGFLLFHQIQLTTKSVDSSASLFTQVSKTCEDLTTRQQSRSSTSCLGCPGAKCTDGQPYA
ncbi:hypothetical protein CHARACLAT_030455 [Characodon lateralis]|uniref:Uncharacterized protein n=1 Tax=Characodon lateralis TaxID=208331 RepID=A0ABU7EE60_9TELE|nr:hypothetical protein [Characodon lateralis]